MDTKSKILIWIFVALIIIAVALTFWRIMIKRDYVISSQIDCDPTVEKCFIWRCDPTSTVEGEACTGDPETDVWYYQIAQRNASRIPLCDPATDETCLPFACDEGEKDCSVTFCDPETAGEDEECNDPEEYNLNNPSEEEDADLSADEAECDIESGEECAPATEEGNAEEAPAEGTVPQEETGTAIE